MPTNWVCGEIRASDTPDGRPAVSGQVERRPTKEEIQRQRDLKAHQEWLQKMDDDVRRLRKQLEDLNKERDEMRGQFEKTKKQIEDLKMHRDSIPLGLVPIPRGSKERINEFFKDHDEKMRRIQERHP